MKTNKYQNPKVLEMIGHSDMGMQKEALELAKTILDEEGLNFASFNEAVQVLLIQADDLGTWKETVETAFVRLSDSDQWQVQLDEPLLQNALSGLVKIQAVRAWKHLQQGLGQIKKFKDNIDVKTELKLPGNHDVLLEDAKKELESYREALEKIVPENTLAQYGRSLAA